mmetsp:Transcript_1346/g.2434  ORF Transcript_1346/g.2434 Transcript_1346/m.2434 type:complete len:887 (+) Transcript_1346:264-2924(+)
MIPISMEDLHDESSPLLLVLQKELRRNLVDSEIDAIPDSVSPSEVIVSTFKIYGSIFLVCFAMFLVLRAKFPLVYTYNSRVLKHITPLSRNRHGSLQWIPRVFTYTDDEIFQHCGMAAIVYLRFLRLGFKLSLVGIFNSFFLIPSNLYGCNPATPVVVTDDATTNIINTNTTTTKDICASLTDRVEKIALSHVSPGEENIWATTVAAYIIFGSAMYFIFQEFEWFTEYRHKFCTQPRPDNYTVYVSHIPEEYRSDGKLLHYFRSIFTKDAVLEASVAMDISNLEKKVQERAKVMEKLEHAVNIRNVKGFEPKHGNPLGETLESIPTFAAELNTLNDEIKVQIEEIENKKMIQDQDVPSDLVEQSEQVSLVDDENTTANDNQSQEPSVSSIEEEVKHHGKLSTLTKNITSFRNLTLDTMKGAAGTVGGTILNSANMALNLITGSQDGTVRDAGFVTFSSLLVKNQCVQTIHHSTPFTFYTMNAPRPRDVVWGNVGKSHKEQQLSYLLAQGATIATCLFWTIPVSFLSSLSEVEKLQELIPGLEKALVKNPWLASLLAQLSPLMLVLLTSLLPVILTVYCKKEGHIGSDTLHASLLTKLAMFMIVQIFFVQALSGSLFSSLAEIAEKPTLAVTLLATSLPAQVKAFIQYVQVQNFLGCGFELLRIPRVVMALIRERIGPNLTEKERSTPYMGILPITEPAEMEYPMLFAEMILYFMINLVYSCIAPIMSYILLVCFGLLSVVFRHQLIYTYSTENDDGGKLWSSAIMLLITCMIVSELTLIGIVFLKLAFIPGVLLVPLIVCTFLFASYLKQQHFKVTEFVPSTVCAVMDRKNRNMDLDFLKGEYKQSALTEKIAYPDNFTKEDSVVYAKKASDVDEDIEHAVVVDEN